MYSVKTKTAPAQKQIRSAELVNYIKMFAEVPVPMTIDEGEEPVSIVSGEQPVTTTPST